MTSKTTHNFSPEVRAQAVRMVLDHEGVRKVWRQMRRDGFSVARCTVERLMRDMGEADQGPRPA